MRVLVQKSKQASCVVDGKTVGKIESGLVLFVGFTETDTIDNIKYLVKKVLNLRIFEDEFGVMNKSLLEQENKEVLSVSQFTLYADTKKGNRPSYIKALNGNDAKKLYDLWNEELKKEVSVKTGIFGADMQISLINDGPTTIWLER
ncbi:D-tyrosyl-tRNA(Tyr) deacylase [bacterium]|nr:D-tyrosyl-tRNA(Tyr) deacylase [bacterium]